MTVHNDGLYMQPNGSEGMPLHHLPVDNLGELAHVPGLSFHLVIWYPDYWEYQISMTPEVSTFHREILGPQNVNSAFVLQHICNPYNILQCRKLWLSHFSSA